MARFLPSLPMALPGEQPTGRIHSSGKDSEDHPTYRWEGGDLVLLSADFLKEAPGVGVSGTLAVIGEHRATLLRYSWTNDSYLAERVRGK